MAKAILLMCTLHFAVCLHYTLYAVFSALYTLWSLFTVAACSALYTVHFVLCAVHLHCLLCTALHFTLRALPAQSSSTFRHLRFDSERLRLDLHSTAPVRHNLGDVPAAKRRLEWNQDEGE